MWQTQFYRSCKSGKKKYVKNNSANDIIRNESLMVHIRYSTNFSQSDDSTASRNARGSCFLWLSQLFHEFHLEILLLRRRTTNWSKKWHKERDGKNGRERERKKSKIKIQDAFQVLVIVLNETTLYFI